LYIQKIKRLLLAAALLFSALSVGCVEKNDEEIANLREQVTVLEYRVAQLEQMQQDSAQNEMFAAPAGVEEQSTAYDAQSMTSAEAEALRASIDSIDAVREHFDAIHPELMMSAHFMTPGSSEMWLPSAQEICTRAIGESAGRGCIVHAATYLLQDDMEIDTVIGFRSDAGGGMPMYAINCIKTEKGYRFVDPVRGMRGDEMSRFGAILPEAETATLEEYVQLLLADPMIAGELDNLYRISDTGEIRFNERQDGYAELMSSGELLYHNENVIPTEQLTAHIKPENIDAYQISNMLGGVTLSTADAYALVNASPEEAQKKIKTAADVLMYLLAAQTGDCGGCFCENFDGFTWHYNMTAKQVMETRLGNCGSCANFVNYMLKDDYDEVGIIQHAYDPGNGGGHVYNYVLYDGSYYILDFSWYIFSQYAPSNDFPVMPISSLEEYGNRIDELYGGVSLMIALTSSGQHLPNIFGEDFGDSHYYVPKGAEYVVLFESGDGYRIGEMPLDKKYHDWTKYW